MAVLLQAFPDIHVTINEVIAHHDKVVLRNTVTGTHRGDYRGLPATGRTITYNEIFIARFAEEKSLKSGVSSTSTPSCGNSALFPPGRPVELVPRQVVVRNGRNGG